MKTEKQVISSEQYYEVLSQYIEKFFDIDPKEPDETLEQQIREMKKNYKVHPDAVINGICTNGKNQFNQQAFNMIIFLFAQLANIKYSVYQEN